ncbi:hypothetical protein JOB18_021411 [Solea senegalensis]|uniref:Uncharacterized protein n=1 Tax=Solea senegalensis TaxID=28829 RepID=A0AAV6SMJ7_SOLSE|nr:hypothetical protein JOB18_021411 [Solea senegalensis]
MDLRDQKATELERERERERKRLRFIEILSQGEEEQGNQDEWPVPEGEKIGDRGLKPNTRATVQPLPTPPHKPASVSSVRPKHETKTTLTRTHY